MSVVEDNFKPPKMCVSYEKLLKYQTLCFVSYYLQRQDRLLTLTTHTFGCCFS